MHLIFIALKIDENSLTVVEYMQVQQYASKVAQMCDMPLHL